MTGAGAATGAHASVEPSDPTLARVGTFLFGESSLNRIDNPDNQGWRAATDLRFAQPLEAIALALNEIAVVAQSVPVAFHQAKGRWRVMAIFAPGDGRNRFVDEVQGHWHGPSVPALLRAYPFMLHRAGSGSEQGRLALWPGARSEPLGPGVEPFAIDGKPTERVRQTLSLLAAVHEDIDRAHAVLCLLQSAEVLVPWLVTGVDGPVTLAGVALRVVDPQRLHALAEVLFLQLRDLGALGWLYAHLHSLHLAKVFLEDVPHAWTLEPLVGPLAPPVPGTAGPAHASDATRALADFAGGLEW
jgi:hypothetical protein